MLGLVAALEHLCVELSRAGFTITFTHDLVPPTLAPEVMLCLFRVVQEALQNAIKHSKAKDVSVHLGYDGDGLTVTIVDSGVGFDVEAAWGNGVGLVSMVERLEAIGGTLRIDSRRGEGTRLTASVVTDLARDTDQSPSEAASVSENSSTSTSTYGVGM
jgi:signal transduction histidine kinase